MDALRRLALSILRIGGRSAGDVGTPRTPLGSLLRDVLVDDAAEPIDVTGACASLSVVDVETARALVSALADIAVAGGLPSDAVIASFTAVVRALGVPAAEGEAILEAAFAAQSLGVTEPRLATDGGSRESLDAGYLTAVEYFDPAALGRFGPEFAALAINRLSDVTLEYEMATAALDLVS